MNARWMIAREGHEIIKGRGAHRPEKTPADIPAEPSLFALVMRGIRSAVSR